MIFAYLRLSVGEPESAGIKYQEADIKNRFSAEYPRIEFHRETASAVKNIRPVWEALFPRIVAAAEKGEKPVLLVWSVDRILRNADDFPLATRILDAGVSVRTFRDGDFSADQFFTFSIRAIMAIEEPRMLKKRQSARYADGFKKGEWFWRVPHGYIRRETKIFIDEKTAEKVREIFRKFLDFCGGIESFSPTAAKILGKKYISKSNLRHFFGNRFLLGEAEFRGEKFPNHHAGIISRELFSAVRNKIQNRVQKKIRTHDFLFRGKIFCNCGRRFVGETQKGIVYYRCHKCKKSFREELAEECVSDFFKKYKFTEKGAKFYLEKIRKEKNSEFQKLSAERGKITKRLREIDEILSGLVDMRATGEIDSQIFLERKNSLLVERAEIFDRREKSEKKLPNAIESIAKMLELIESRFLSWDLANLETKALILKMLGSNFFYLPKNTLEMRVFSFLEAYFLGDRAKWWSLSPKTRTKYEIEIVFFESALKEFTEKSF